MLLTTSICTLVLRDKVRIKTEDAKSSVFIFIGFWKGLNLTYIEVILQWVQIYKNILDNG